MTTDLQKKLKSRWENYTTSEQKIAAYLLHNIGGIPFETAASLAERAGVSAMTVGRFLRKLGYADIGGLKEELRNDRGAPWLKLYRNLPQPGGADSIGENLAAEIRVLNQVHALVGTEEWKSIVTLLATAERVSVASFQLGRFLGLTFATLLQHVRPRVVFDPGVDGAYSDLLLDSTAKSCVVLIDERRYSKHFRILAEEVVAHGIPLVILTDTQCYWARQFTRKVLMIPIHTDRAWHSFGAFSSLFSLLLGDVIRELGDSVYRRIGDIETLRQRFVGFSGPSLASGKSRKAATNRTHEAKRNRRR